MTETTVVREPLTRDELTAIDAWWRAANYLSVGQIYLLGNPLLAEPLRPEHVKPRLLGHWGTTPGLNLIYAHLNRVITAHDLDVIYVCGPGHGGPGMVANTYLEGTYTELYPHITQDTAGLGRLFKQFSFPGGIPSHAAPETPGSIHEGGELGYSLLHAYGAAFDNPELIAACVIGDGEAETGPLAGSWHANKFLDPARDGAVLPILHLNGYKIANPTVLARIPGRRAGGSAAGVRVRGAHGGRRRPGAGAPAARGDHGRRWSGRSGRSGGGRGPPAPVMPAGRRGRSSCCGRRRGGPGRRWWTGCRWRGPGGRTRCRSPRRAPTRSTWPSWRTWLRSYRAGGAVRSLRRAGGLGGAARAGRQPADEREPARQRGAAAP